MLYTIFNVIFSTCDINLDLIPMYDKGVIDVLLWVPVTYIRIYIYVYIYAYIYITCHMCKIYILNITLPLTAVFLTAFLEQ